MASLEDLATELLDMIFTYTISCDKFVITSKQMRKNEHEDVKAPPSRVTSRLTLAFASHVLRPEYRRFLEDYISKHANVVRVNVVDYGFHNFPLFLKDMVKAKARSTGEATFDRFHFSIGGANPLDRQDLEGPYFAANIIFTRNFDSEDTKLLRWAKKAETMAKWRGHLRMFYKVTRLDDSPAFNDMLRRQGFGREEEMGQLVFLKEAIRTNSASRAFDADLLQQFEEADINRGRIEDDYVGESDGIGEEIDDGGPQPFFPQPQVAFAPPPTQANVKTEPDEDEQKVDLGWSAYARVPAPPAASIARSGPYAFVPLLPAEDN
ncbi:hypothetical protein LTR36_000264 [Oleoguttula mirabilis]|uniref:Uncharacterized protein n=1 Tax=Oleoguttula mirabilis TaxID=1507867 RepID=A0AAV9JYK0_9PEZI|nr:hypothetical protein LTR36_000264 [Oleoguttula mirabilis]